MAKVTRIRELSGFTGEACLVKRRDRYFVVSSTNAFGGFETLVFPADANGTVTNWLEVAGGRGVGRREAMEELASLDFRKRYNGRY